MTRLEKLVQRIPTHLEVILCGSAAIAARGGRDVNDLDVLTRRAAPLRKMDLCPLDGYDGRTIWRYDTCDGKIEYMTSVPRLSAKYAEIRDKAEEMHIAGRTIAVMSLRHCLAIKAAAFRPADIPDMEWLIAAIGKAEMA
jgi:hypothetical protein